MALVVALACWAGAPVAHAQLTPDTTKMPPIVRAAVDYDAERVVRLLDEGADPNATGPGGLTPLMAAAYGDHVKAMRPLLEAGADATAADAKGWTPLHWAAVGRPEAGLQLLVDAGADVEATDDGGLTPLMYAAAEGPTQVVRRLVCSIGASPEATDPAGVTAAGYAVNGGNLISAHILSERDCSSDVGEEDVTESVRTRFESLGPANLRLFNAVSSGRVDGVKEALARGGDLEARNADGETPLLVAVGEGHFDVLRFLAERGASVHARSGALISAVRLATRLEPTDESRRLVQYLIDRGSPVEAPDNYGRTALRMAVEAGDESFVRLLHCEGASTSSMTVSFITPIVMAEHFGYEDVAAFLKDPECVSDEELASIEEAQRAEEEAQRRELERLRDSIRTANRGGKAPDTSSARTVRVVVGEDGSMRRVDEDQPPSSIYDWKQEAQEAFDDGNYTRALAAYATADSMLSESRTPTSPDLLRVRRQRALTLKNLGRFDEALSVAEDLVRVREREARTYRVNRDPREQPPFGPPHEKLSEAVALVASIQEERGAYEEALASAERALTLRTRTTALNDPESVVAYGLVARMHERLGQYDQANQKYGRAMRFVRSLQGFGGTQTAPVLVDYANFLRTQGEYGRARPLLERAITSLEAVAGPEHPRTASLKRSLGLLLLEQGDLSAAQPPLEQALSIRKETLGDAHPDVAESLDDLARLRIEQRRLAAAQSQLERALQIRVDALGEDHPLTAASRASLGRVLLAQGEVEAAETRLQTALDSQNETLGPSHPSTGETWADLGALYARSDRPSEALTAYRRALDIRTQTLGEEHPSTTEARTAVALQELRAGEEAEAAHDRLLASARAITRHTEEVLPSLSLAEQRAFLSEDVARHTGILLSEIPDERLTEVYDQVVRWKGLLLNTLRTQTVISRLSDDPRREEAVKRLSELRSALAGWYQQAGSVPDERWRAVNDSLTEQKESLERVLVDALPEDALEDPIAGGLEAFQERLPDETAFVDVFRHVTWSGGERGRARYTAVVTTADGSPQRVDLGSSRDVERAVSAWRSAVVRGAPSETAWNELTSTVWQPVADAIGSAGADAHTVWLSPDGALARVPWHLFTRPELTGVEGAGGTGLTLSQIGSAREWLRLQNREGTRTASSSEPTSRRALLVGGVRFGEGSGEPRFAPLPGTEREVEQIAGLAKQQFSDVDLLTGDDATREAVQRLSDDAQAIHLATHGFFMQDTGASGGSRGSKVLRSRSRADRSRNPLVESGLALAGANAATGTSAGSDTSRTAAPDTTGPSAQTGLLTAEEMVGLDLRAAQIVTLSACDTGRGEEVTGQGVMGLRSSVIAAGAETLLMSLWKVPDASTALLMETFYEGLWTKNLTPTQALHRAQQTVREEYPHPRHWAAWILDGGMGAGA